MKKLLREMAVIFCIVMLTACGCMKNNAKVAVENFLNQYKSLNSKVLDDLEKVILKENFTKENGNKYRDTMKKQYRDLKYKIIDETYNGDSASVKVKITVYDLYKVQNEAAIYLNSHMDEFKNDKDEYDNNKYLSYKLDQMKKSTDTVDYTLEFKLSKDEKGNWVVDKLTQQDLEKIHGIYNYNND